MSNFNKNLILIIAGILILIGITKPNLSDINIFPPNKPVNIDVLELPEPTDTNIKNKANLVVDILRKGGNDRKIDGKKLRDLSLDLATLISLDGENMVIKNTEEIRQANKLSGVMLRLDIKGKYADLAQQSKELVISAIGDDMILLTPELRAKAVEAFQALAWAYNEGSK